MEAISRFNKKYKKTNPSHRNITIFPSDIFETWKDLYEEVSFTEDFKNID
jgi:hypothetical protein